MRTDILTTRDHAILRDAWLFRYVTTSQIARLYFNGHAKLAQRRLRVLHQRALLDRFRPVEAIRTGFGEWWYRLARVGARLLAEREEVLPAALLPPKRRPRAIAFLAHHALTTDFRIWLREGCEASDTFSGSFIPAYEEVQGHRQRRVALTLGRGRVLVPDGVFTLTRDDGRHALFALEVDRGTEPLTGTHRSAVERKLIAYRDAYDARAETGWAELFGATCRGFRLLCLVPDKRRQHAFLRLAARIDLAPLVWATTTDLVEQPGDLNATVWATAPGTLHALTE